jgi:hypothetical protein
MKASVCFTPQSFDFNLDEEHILTYLKFASELVGKMSNGFVSFLKSSEFDNNAAEKIFQKKSSLDAGAVMSLLYDQQMSMASTIDLSEDEVIHSVNTTPPIHECTWMSVYFSEPTNRLISEPSRIIYSEKNLVDYCSEILIENPRAHNEYAKNFVEIYTNLIFLYNPRLVRNTTFDSIRKIEGGYTKFIRGITDCLSYMNEYEVIPHDSKHNINQLNAHLDFPITVEGGGKNKRTIKALKRNFLINSKAYDDVNCEYHYKLERSDGANGNGTYYFNRIYFGFFNRIDEDKPKIAIAHIGEHL